MTIRAQKIAYIISVLLSNPIVDSIFAFVLALNESYVKFRHYDLTLALISVLLLGILPFSGAFIAYIREGGDIFVSEREKRPKLILIGMVPLLISAFYFYLTGYSWLSALSTLFFLESLVYLLITLKWKISLHVSGLSIPLTTMMMKCLTSSMEGLLAFLNPMLVFFGLITLPFLMWARVKVGAHTWSQVIASAILSIFMTYYGLKFFVVH